MLEVAAEPFKNTLNQVIAPHEDDQSSIIEKPIQVHVHALDNNEVLQADTVADSQLLDLKINEHYQSLLFQLKNQTIIHPIGCDCNRIENIHSFLDEELYIWSPKKYYQRKA